MCPSGVFEAGVCSPCHKQCKADMCVGPGPGDCADMPAGCVGVYSGGNCTTECSDLEILVPTGECVCNGYADTDGSCKPCHEGCDGCYGPGPGECNQCSSFRKGATCVSECGTEETPGLNNECLPCHPQCSRGGVGFSGCEIPGDAGQCGCFSTNQALCDRQAKCRNYDDAGRCSAACSLDRPYTIDCAINSGLGLCANSVDKMCVSQCPPFLPLYNDTRPSPTMRPSMPQLCVAACAELGSAYTVVLADANGPARCVNVELDIRQFEIDAAADNNAEASTSLGDNATFVVVVAIVAAVVVLVFLYVCLNTCCAQKEQQVITSPADPTPWASPAPASSPYATTQNDTYSPRPLTTQLSSHSFQGGAMNTSGNSYSNGLSALGEDSMMGMTDSVLFQPHESTKL